MSFGDYKDLAIKIIIPIITLLAGYLVDHFRSKIKFSRELKANNQIDISGNDWFAAWQTSVKLTSILNTEHLNILQKGQTVKMCNTEKSPENPDGGYLWIAQMHFFNGRHLMGWYLPRKKENITSKGIMFLSYQSSKKVFYGKWVGASYDGDLSNGFVVISKDRGESLRLLQDLLARHNDQVNIIYDAI